LTADAAPDTVGVMRMRASLTAGVVVALLLPAAALAARRVIHGPAGSGSGTVDITLVAKNGNVKKLTRFEFNNIAANCAGNAPTATSGTFPHTIKVGTDGRFHTTVKQNGGRVTFSVRGHFTSQDKAAGTLRIKGAVPGCGTADTGKVHWSAKHN
jgi:hypothetical protein